MDDVYVVCTPDIELPMFWQFWHKSSNVTHRSTPGQDPSVEQRRWGPRRHQGSYLSWSRGETIQFSSTSTWRRRAFNMRSSFRGSPTSKTPGVLGVVVDVCIDKSQFLAAYDATRGQFGVLWETKWSSVGLLPRYFGHSNSASVSEGLRTPPIVHGRIGRPVLLPSGSWADSISMVRKLHPTIVDAMIEGIDRDPPHVSSLSNCEHVFCGARKIVRRFRLPLHFWPPSCSVRAGGVLGGRGFALECVAAQVCREAGATNVFVRELRRVPRVGGRRMEVIADGHIVWRGVQLAIDTTLV